MRRMMISVLASGILLFAVASSASAHNAGPCNDSGEPGHSDYAKHHIVALAHAHDMGMVDHDGDGVRHVPGVHRGYSVCVNMGE